MLPQTGAAPGSRYGRGLARAVPRAMAEGFGLVATAVSLLARAFDHGDGVPAVQQFLRAALALSDVRRAAALPVAADARQRGRRGREPMAADAVGAHFDRPAAGSRTVLQPPPPLHRRAASLGG